MRHRAHLWLHFPIQNQSGRQGRHIFFIGFISSLNADLAETDTEMRVANIPGIGRAQPDTLVTPPPSRGCGSPYTSPTASHPSQQAERQMGVDSTVLGVTQPAGPPSQGSRGRSSSLRAQTRGQFLLQSKPSFLSDFPYICSAALSSRLPSKAP